ncbi:MAG: ABC transporter ATP-binding protein [Limisphaerales bacterium]|jgi:ABC-2 type transport system ATP-binding protein|nr:ABC transporter ATP-binding protein [Verrucomicrobiota bacterium]
MPPIIKADKLSRWYGMVMGLNHISFEVLPGITGLVGPNGAGKSTLIQIITGQLRPSSGCLKVLGHTPWDHPPTLARIGYCPEKEALPEHLRPLDWLMSLGMLSGLPKTQVRNLASKALNRVRLREPDWARRLGQYSKGMRQRVKLAQAIMHGPELLVLDEPMNGLDPMGRQGVASILKELASEGVNILISSHILAELEPLCRQIMILNWGRVMATGAHQSIRSELADWPEQLAILCDNPQALASLLFERGHLTGFDAQQESGRLSIRIKDPNDFFPQWASLLKQSGVVVHEIRSGNRSLQTLFEKVTKS